jgi:4-hydroxythreonine-4-phosphate dehydrogenase
MRGAKTLLVGDLTTLREAAELTGVAPARLVAFDGRLMPGRIAVLDVEPALSATDRRAGRPTRRSGAAQLAYLRAAYAFCRAEPGRALVTAPVNKAAIARSGARGARGFRGHTEWLARQDGAQHGVMCFVTPRFSTSLVTTHLPLSRVPRSLTPEAVHAATVALARLLQALGVDRPHIAITSLNPHAGEDELLGREERTVIVPGMRSARRALRGKAKLIGPVGAETAYRHAHARALHGVVAMFHDQATIPTKLVAFGSAVNVTMGLSIVRTSVDHGTAYDIAWRGTAEPLGMLSAMRLARRLVRERT